MVATEHRRAGIARYFVNRILPETLIYTTQLASYQDARNSITFGQLLTRPWPPTFKNTRLRPFEISLPTVSSPCLQPSYPPLRGLVADIQPDISPTNVMLWG